MATPTGITLISDSVIVEVDSIANSPVMGNKFNGGYVRIIGTAWSGDPVLGDFIQFNEDKSILFNQEGVIYAYVPFSDYLFIQTAL